MKKKELLKRIEILESMVGKFEVHKCMPTEKPIVSVPQWAKNLMKEASKDLTAPSIQPHPTAEKFKAIAAHANAINDVIQNAPKDETIYVPDGILNAAGNIVNGKHILSPEKESYDVMFLGDDVSKSKPNQFKLVPCKREDLKVGDVAFRNMGHDEINRLCNYCIVLNGKVQYWDGDNCMSDNIDYLYWYKVVEA